MGCFSGQKPRKKLLEQQPKPQPAAHGDEPVLSAPPSFRRRVRAIQNAQRFINSNPKLRSSLPSYGSRESSTRDAAAALASPTEPSMRGRARSATAEIGSSLVDITTLRNRPMPLPSPQRLSAYRLPLPNNPSPSYSAPLSPLSPSPTFTSPRISPSITAMGLNGKVYPSDLQRLPPRREPLAGLRSFTYDELGTACQIFDRCVADSGGDSSSYTGIIKVKAEKQEITVMRVCESWQQGYKEWLAELSTIVRLHGPHLCKLLGFYAEEGCLTKRFLVYEKLPKGSLDGLLFGPSDSPPLDWPTRVKIVYGAVQGLSSLHEKSPEQVLYHDFRSSNIQVDLDYSSKLSGYHFGASNYTGLENASTGNQRADAYRAPETVSRGEISPRSNVWSLGIVVLELLTGRQNMDHRVPREESNLVKWAKPFLMDESKLFLIMDPKLQGRFPSKGARMIAELALQCLLIDPTKRPTMRKVADIVKSVQEMRYAIRFPSKDPNTLSPPYSPSPVPSLGFSPSGRSVPKLSTQEGAHHRSPTNFDMIESPQLKPLIIPPRSCATSFAMEESLADTHQQDFTSGPLERLQGC